MLSSMKLCVTKSRSCLYDIPIPHLINMSMRPHFSSSYWKHARLYTIHFFHLVRCNHKEKTLLISYFQLDPYRHKLKNQSSWTQKNTSQQNMMVSKLTAPQICVSAVRLTHFHTIASACPKSLHNLDIWRKVHSFACGNTLGIWCPVPYETMKAVENAVLKINEKPRAYSKNILRDPSCRGTSSCTGPTYKLMPCRIWGH